MRIQLPPEPKFLQPDSYDQETISVEGIAHGALLVDQGIAYKLKLAAEEWALGAQFTGQRQIL